MLYVPKIPYYLKFLTNEKVKDFAVIKFGECFKSTTEALRSKLGEKNNLNRC